jgi:hypothetical protein
MGGDMFVAISSRDNQSAAVMEHMMDHGASSNEVTYLSLRVLKPKKCNTASIYQLDVTHLSDELHDVVLTLPLEAEAFLCVLSISTLSKGRILRPKIYSFRIKSILEQAGDQI